MEYFKLLKGDYIKIPDSHNIHGLGVFIHKGKALILSEFRKSEDQQKRILSRLLQNLNEADDHRVSTLNPARPLTQKEIIFDISLPGCMAKVCYSDRNYYVFDIGSSNKKPQNTNNTRIYLAQKKKDEWQTESEDLSDIGASGINLFSITDSAKVCDRAAKIGALALMRSTYAAPNHLDQFYLHHTYDEKNITSFFRRKSITHPLNIKEIEESSKYLANTMLTARIRTNKWGLEDEQEKTVWVSSRGGSAVLTQALDLLKQRGISFRGYNHHIYFDEIASDADQGLLLALELGFKVPFKPFTKRFLSFRSLTVGNGNKARKYRLQTDHNYSPAMALCEQVEVFTKAVLPAVSTFLLMKHGAIVAMASVSLFFVTEKVYTVFVVLDQFGKDLGGRYYEVLKRKMGLIK